MKRNSLLTIGLTIASLLAGYLLSAISFVGRTGIDLFYTKYRFLKSWWKGALIVFIVWMLLLAVQTVLEKKVKKATSTIIQWALLTVAIAGLYMSYADFRNSLSHRWLGESFHLGVYLFWLGWIVITIFMLLKKEPLKEAPPIEDQSASL